MTKTFDKLIKIEQVKIDNLRKDLAQIEERKLNTIDKIDAIKQAKIDEGKFIFSAPEMSFAVGSFIQSSHKKQQGLETELQGLENIIEMVQDQIAQNLGEKKRFEILRDKKIERENYKANKKEQEELDEIATQKFL